MIVCCLSGIPPKNLPVKKPPVNIQKLKELRLAVRHAKLLCFGYEDTIECEVAWQKVDVLLDSLKLTDPEYNDIKYDD